MSLVQIGYHRYGGKSIENREFVRVQKPYSFDAASEMMVELIETPIVLNLESKPDVRTQLGNVNTPIKSDTGADAESEVATGREMYRITEHKGDIWTFVFSPDRKILASGSADATIRLWDAITGNKILTLPTYTNQVFAVAFSPDGKILAGGGVYDSQLGRSDSIRLWEIRSGRILTTFTGHTSTVSVVRFSPDGKILASSSGDGTILLWDLDRIVQIER